MFRVELLAAEGVNFPYYVMGKAQLRIPPFADPWVWVDSRSDPYTLFAQEYGTESAEVGDAEELWYGWLSRVLSDCPDDAGQSLAYCDPPLLSVARSILPEYLSRWPEIHGNLTQLMGAAVSDSDLSSALRRNEQLFGLSYPESGREIIHFNHFPTVATQKPGPHFIFGLGLLYRPEALLSQIESEVGLTLLEQITRDERVRFYGQRLAEVTARDRYVQGVHSLLEALNNVVRAAETSGAAVALGDVPRKPGEQGYQRIVECLFRNRHLWGRTDLVDFVCASLRGL